MNNTSLISSATRTALAVLLIATPIAITLAAEPGDHGYASGRLIVIPKSDAISGHKHALSVRDTLVDRVHVSATGAYVLSLNAGTSAQEAKQLAERLRTSGAVASVEPDVIVRPMSSPAQAFPFAGPVYGDGSAFPNALSLAATRQLFSGLNLTPAPVAAVDSGITSHTLLQKVLPGYNFYTLLGNARSPDYSDHGDGVSSAEAASPPFQAINCQARDSRWHGTAVAGLIGAQFSAGYHVEGVAPGASILPAKALGKCGGWVTDILDAALWSAGVHVPGVPDNLNPVRIVNMSLGAKSACTAVYQSAIDQLTTRGVIVVAAGGNENEDTRDVLPANCKGVMTIAATDHNGNLAAYSARGSNVTLAAPGGESHLGIFTTSDLGTLTPAGETSTGYFGTSVSTAIVSGVASLMIALNPALQPNHVGKILKATAMPIANCAADCGGGLLNADAAVRVAYSGVSYGASDFSPTVIGTQSDASVQVNNVSGLTVVFGGAVFGGLNPADFTKVADTCSGATLNDGDSCVVTVRFAPTATGQRQATLQISSNMPSGGIAVPLSAASVANPGTPPPVSDPSGSTAGASGGGGCTIASLSARPDPLLPLLVLMAFAWLGWRRRGT